ncbi:hypothetical protein AAJ76_2900011584 [Vairimorpha ceranae]|uniref:Uncharacterized protein n=1 Tax=Vairimorpha ceranae TaxID=40302 RepID=A0A0F9WQF7_9MICR|nr:hypothetical protein AAJ76_2900011584 [Vairimorpha ceranae]KKO75173.1 hypothetical protein AAJ76_2900011584 [Vairimorpha ceranae]
MNIKNLYEPIFFRCTVGCVCGAYMKQVESTLFKEGICFYCANGCYKRQRIKTGTIL